MLALPLILLLLLESLCAFKNSCFVPSWAFCPYLLPCGTDYRTLPIYKRSPSMYWINNSFRRLNFPRSLIISHRIYVHSSLFCVPSSLSKHSRILWYRAHPIGDGVNSPASSHISLWWKDTLPRARLRSGWHLLVYWERPYIFFLTPSSLYIRHLLFSLSKNEIMQALLLKVISLICAPEGK